MLFVRGIVRLQPMTVTATRLLPQLVRVADYHLHTARYAASVVSDGAAIYVVGGRDKTDHDIGAIERFDLRTHAVTEISAAIARRAFTSAVMFGNRIYIFGGEISGDGDPRDRVEIVDLADDTVKPGGLMPGQLRRISGVLVNGRVFFIGGEAPSLHAIKKKLDRIILLPVFEPATAKWFRGKASPLSLETCAVSMGRMIIVAGGSNKAAEYASVECYDTKADTWFQLPPLCVPCSDNSAAILGRTEYLFGRRGSEGDVVAYDPASGYSCELSQTGFAPAVFTAAVTCGNSIYVIGGETALNGGETQEFGGEQAGDEEGIPIDDIQVFSIVQKEVTEGQVRVGQPTVREYLDSLPAGTAEGPHAPAH